MMYLSLILGKKVDYNGKMLGTLTDVAILEEKDLTRISKIIVKKDRTKVTLPADKVEIDAQGIHVSGRLKNALPYDDKEFYLNEDLLDKQVIDVDGKRLVRVNDVLLEKNGVIKVVGIDVSVGGILRRLGLSSITHMGVKILPWHMIEAFDYQTGTIKVKVAQNKLNTFHPAELADILEEVGTKERLGIVEVLDTEKAADAIEEANAETQEAILEQLPDSFLRRIVNRMPLSEIADVFYKLNPLRLRAILKALGTEKAERVEQLVRYPQKTAGGLMTTDFLSVDAQTTAGELLTTLEEHDEIPETIIVTNGGGKFTGLLDTKKLLRADKQTAIKDLIKEKKSVSANVRFPRLLQIFTQYNLRLLPVLDKEKKPIGIISIDTILSMLEQEQEYDETL